MAVEILTASRMRFTLERVSLVKMLRAVSQKQPGAKHRENEVRIAACDARVFVEANDVIGGVEALVLQDGTCYTDLNVLKRLVQSYSPRKNITIEVDERKLRIAGSSRDVWNYSPHVFAPAKFRVFPVQDNWLAEPDQPAPDNPPDNRWLNTRWWE